MNHSHGRKHALQEATRAEGSVIGPLGGVTLSRQQPPDIDNSTTLITALKRGSEGIISDATAATATDFQETIAAIQKLAGRHAR